MAIEIQIFADLKVNCNLSKMEVLKAAFYPNIPQSFRIVNLKGEIQLVGPYAETVKHFAKYNRYDFQYDVLPSYKVSRVQKSIQQGVYNISMHSVAYNNKFADISFSYPLEWSKVCVMVPTLPELPRYWYVILPFDRYIWIFLCLMVLYVAVLMRVLKHPTSVLIDNLFTSLAVVLNSSNMNLKLVNAAHKLQLFYALLLLMGFILSSCYCSYLTVYNLKPIHQPYPRTVDDLLKTKRQIWMPSQILEEMRNNPHVNLTRVESIIVEKPQSEVTRQIQDLSRKYAYTVILTDWLLTEKLQKELIQPIYKLSDICPITSYSTYPVAENSTFAASLDIFILLVRQSGLWEFWEEQAFSAALQANFFSILLDSYPIDPLNLHYFRIAWYIFAVGIISASVCILAEIAVHNYKLKKKRKAKLIKRLRKLRFK